MGVGNLLRFGHSPLLLPYKVTQLFWFSEKKREKKTHGNKIKSEKPLFGEDFFRVVEQF